MTWFIVLGDALVLGGFIGLVAWLFARRDGRAAASIPLADEEPEK